jgi:type IV pilus assembly protein PilA
MRDREVRDTAEGFTLIELLVVIIIIGILAAIAIPTYLKQREKGWRVQAVNDMKNAATALESWATEQGGDYSGLNGVTENDPALRNEGYRHNSLVGVTVVATTSEYCIRGTHVHLPGIEWVYRSGVGVVQSGAPGVIPC